MAVLVAAGCVVPPRAIRAQPHRNFGRRCSCASKVSSALRLRACSAPLGPDAQPAPLSAVLAQRTSSALSLLSRCAMPTSCAMLGMTRSAAPALGRSLLTRGSSPQHPCSAPLTPILLLLLLDAVSSSLRSDADPLGSPRSLAHPRRCPHVAAPPPLFLGSEVQSPYSVCSPQGHGSVWRYAMRGARTAHGNVRCGAPAKGRNLTPEAHLAAQFVPGMRFSCPGLRSSCPGLSAHSVPGM
eukprot:2753086-Rhodomonas_salina.1